MKLILVIVAMTLGCNGDVTPIETPEDPCLDQGCSDHGQCAVVVGGTAVCICDVGYHSEGLSCVENVVGAECEGVTCSNHGTCVVVRGDPDYPFCVCDQGYHNAGDTNCVEGSGGMTCGAGTHEEGGVCVPDDTEHPPASWTHVSTDSSFPMYMRMSPDGRYLIYSPITSLGGKYFEITTIRLRDLITQNEIDLSDAELNCSASCYLRPSAASFSPNSQLAMLSNTVYELSTGVGTPLPQGLSFKSFTPDSSGVVCIDTAAGRLVHVSIPDMSINFLMDTTTSSGSYMKVGFFTGAQGIQVVANMPVSGNLSGISDIRAVAIEGGSLVTLAQDVVGFCYARNSMVVSSAGYVIYQGTMSDVYSVPVSGGAHVLLGQASGDMRTNFMLSPDETSVLIKDYNNSLFVVVPVEGDAGINVGGSFRFCRWADNHSLACLTENGEIHRYPLPSGPFELIADGGVMDFLVQGTRLLYTTALDPIDVSLYYEQGSYSDMDYLRTKKLYLNQDGVESLVWRDVESYSQISGLTAIVANESLTVVALNVMYFDIMRDYAPGPNNGVWVAPLP